MFKIGIASLFRDSMLWFGLNIDQVGRYFQQIYSQEGFCKEDFGFFLLEGDSKDDTYDALLKKQADNKNIEIIQANATYNMVTSTDDPNRIQSVSRLGSMLIDLAKERCEYLIWVESDLIFNSTLFKSLLKDISNESLNAGMVSPIAMLHNQPVFYDTWAFRNLDDSRWNNAAPYSPTINKYERFIPMNSTGSCAIIKGEAINRGATFGLGAFVEMSNQIRYLGYNIYVDKNLKIEHPANKFISGRWV